jgi:hypothetical protein
MPMRKRARIEMNYPAASHGVSKTRQQRENIVGASSRVWTCGAINAERFILLLLSPVAVPRRFIFLTL